MSSPVAPSRDAIMQALDGVQDPEIRKPITELGMVDGVTIDGASVTVGVSLTIEGCPLRGSIEADVQQAVQAVPGVEAVTVEIGYMDPERRKALVNSLQRHDSPFSRPDTTTRIIAVASGKGGVGKSTVTVNLAAALAAEGLNVGLIDADVLGFSVPGLMGVTEKPTQVDQLMLPPVAHGVKVISLGMFLNSNEPVMWRGPMLHRALEQFVNDVHFGDLDVLLLDLPPGTGDVAISFSQLLPAAGVVVVTTPQKAAAEVAQRAGAMAHSQGQRVLGVVENMSWMQAPDGSRMTPFGAGGGQSVAEALSDITGGHVPFLAQIPLEESLREGGDSGVPIVVGDPGAASAQVLRETARRLASIPLGLAGRHLGVSPR